MTSTSTSTSTSTPTGGLLRRIGLALPAGAGALAASADTVAADGAQSESQGEIARISRRLALGGITLLSLALHLWNITRSGYGNEYYAAGVLSMSQNWLNFFFNSFDPGGYVTLDKPPLGFWFQVLSAKIFGFSGWSILLPEALAGTAAVLLLYALVRRAFGDVAGLVAALALALTPVSVATARNNTIDTLCVVAVLLAAWAASIAAERGRLRWLALAAVAVGAGFLIKMLQAYLVVPALFLLYLVAAPKPVLTRVAHVTMAGVVMLAVSLSWPIAVDLTPASLRPYVGSTSDNSAVSLALGYNGLERLLGRGRSLETLTQKATGDANTATAGQGGPRVGGMGGGPGGDGENGSPGVFRLLNQQLGGQIGWLLPLALVGLVAAGRATLQEWRADRLNSGRAAALPLWGVWFLTAAGFFSVAMYFHRYYLVMLAPPVAALAAVGLRETWLSFRRGEAFGWLLPVGLLGTALMQAKILADYADYATWLTPVALVLGIGSALALVGLGLYRLIQQRRAAGESAPALPVWLGRAALVSAAAGLAGLMIVPGVWSGLPVVSGQGGGGPLVAGGPNTRGGFPGGPGGGGPGGPPPGVMGQPGAGRQGAVGVAAPGGNGNGNGNGAAGGPPAGAMARGAANGRQFPSGGVPGQPGGAPGQPGGFGPGGFGGGNGANRDALIAYVQANRGEARFLLAVPNANSASGIILATGQPVMALGGFLGSDPILSAEALAAKVAAGEVRFFQIGGGGPGGGGGNGGVAARVQSACRAVPASEIDPNTTSPGSTSNVGSLYDCAGAARLTETGSETGSADGAGLNVLASAGVDTVTGGAR